MRSLFGTDGIRARVGQEPLAERGLVRLGMAIGAWAQEKSVRPAILIAGDPRASSPWVTTLLKGGLLQYPLVVRDAGVLPTPAVCALVKNDETFCAGVVISASHNPHYDNGIKLFAADGEKIGERDEEQITDWYDQAEQCSHERFGSCEPLTRADRTYAACVTANFGSGSLDGTRVVLDCANGAMSRIAPRLFRSFGARVHAVCSRPNGININEDCGSTRPERLCKAVVQRGADIGFAFDGDGDRIVAVNRHGQVRDGDDILALLLTHRLYQRQPAVVGTVLSNYGLERMVTARGMNFYRAQVGDRSVAAELRARDLLLGGEQSGHVLLRDHLPSGDGLFAALRVAQAVRETGNDDMITFDRVPQVLVSVSIARRMDLAREPLASIIERGKVVVADGRVLVRYSGTQNLLRVMVEHEDRTHADRVVSQLSDELQRALSH